MIVMIKSFRRSWYKYFSVWITQKWHENVQTQSFIYLFIFFYRSAEITKWNSIISLVIFRIFYTRCVRFYQLYPRVVWRCKDNYRMEASIPLINPITISLYTYLYIYLYIIYRTLNLANFFFFFLFWMKDL